MRITVTLTAVLEPKVPEDQLPEIAARLENYAADAVKYIDGVDTVSTKTEVEPQRGNLSA